MSRKVFTLYQKQPRTQRSFRFISVESLFLLLLFLAVYSCLMFW